MPLTVNWIVLLLTIISLPANLIVLYLVYKTKESWTLDIKLVFTITIIDILATICNVTFALIGIINKQDVFSIYPAYCQAMGFTIITLLLTSGILIVTLSLERYLIICFIKEIKEIVILAGLIICILLIILLGVFTAVNFEFVISSGRSYCIPNFQGSTISIIYYSAITFFSIFGNQLLNFFYISILIKRKSSLAPIARMKVRRDRIMTRFSEFQNREDEIQNAAFKLEPSSISRKIAIRAIIFLIVYNLAFLPNSIALLWDIITHNYRPPLLDNITSVSLHLIEIINPFMVLTLHSQISREFFALFNRTNKEESDIESATTYSANESNTMNCKRDYNE